MIYADARVMVSVSWIQSELVPAHSHLMSLLQGPLWPGVVAPDRVLSIGHIEMFDLFKLCADKWFMLKCIVRNENFDILTVHKQIADV